MARPDLVAMEDAVRRRLGPAASAALVTVREHSLPEVDADLGPEFRALAADPVYVERAREVIEQAARCAREVQEGAVPFVADKLFVHEEGLVVGRAARCALELDAPWVSLVIQLLADVSVAPTAAKSLPSQATANAIARAIRDAPTPESVAALEQVAKEVRHASVKRRFARFAPVARKALAGRPRVALRVPSDRPMTEPEVKGWLATLEGSWAAQATWSVREWERVVHGRPELSEATADLVWVLGDGSTFRGAPGFLVGPDDAPVTLPEEGRVRLWHPVEASDGQCSAWRDHVHRHRLTQPFKQVFREHYAAGDLHMEGLEIDLKQFVGIARREGWTVEEGAALRRVGDVLCQLRVGANLFPGVAGTASCEGLRLGRPRWAEVTYYAGGRTYLVRRLEEAVPDELPAVVVSEVLRSADLLVSASTVALDDSSVRWSTTPGGALAARRAVLEPVLAELDLDGGPVPAVGKRHVQVGAYRISLATARVTRDGAEAELRPVIRHGLWLPGQDRLLAKIVGLVVAARRAA